MADIADLAH